MNNYNYNYNYTDDMYDRRQSHNHEFVGGVMIAGDTPHYHLVAGVSSEAIPITGGHVHEINVDTTFDTNHLHQIKVRTGLPINIGNDHHVHRIDGNTTRDLNHTHKFEFSSFSD